MVYTAKVPTRGLKLSAYIVALMVIGAIWYALFAIQSINNFAESGVLALLAIGVVLTIIVIVVALLLSRPRNARVVICEHCLAKYEITKPPRIIKEWNLDKFESLVHKGL